MAGFSQCPATPAAALSGLGEATLELARKLPESERCALMQKLLVMEGGEGTSSQVDDEEVTLVGQVMLVGFWLFVIYLIVFFVRVIHNERSRFYRRNACDQGSFRKYLKYRFGYWYTWTPGSAGLVLLTMSLSLLIFGGVLLRVLIQQPLSEGLWNAWLWIAAPDGGGSAETPLARSIGLMISVGGMLVFALLLSVISSTFEDALQGLREGIGPVIEGNHIVILGHLTPMLQIIAKELCNANESEGGTLISILSPLPKPEVEDFLREADGDIKEWMLNSTIVVRSGDACKVEDLQKVGVQGAKKVIIMSKPGIPREDADALTVNVLLALRNNRWPRNGHCVVQCQLVRNQGLFKRLLNDDSQVLSTNDFIGEVMVQCSKQSGLIHVVRSVFSFEGDEFYIQHVQGSAGRTFMELMFALPGVILVGVMSQGSELELLPAMDRVLKDGEKLCVLAEDDSTVPACVMPGVPDGVMVLGGTDVSASRIEERRQEVCEASQIVIIFGWNDSIGAILGEVDNNVGQGSHVIIHSPQAIEIREQFIDAAQKRRSHRYQNFTVEHMHGPLGARFRLEALPLEQANMIFILADESCASASMADSQTMAVIVQVQDIIEERCGPEGSSAVIMPQLLDIATEDTLVQTGIHNYVMASRLAARIMAVVAEVPQVVGIIDCLVKRKSCKFSISKLCEFPAAESFDLRRGLSFNEATMIAALANEVVLGWSCVGAGESGPWEMNPKNRTEKRPWTQECRLVLLRRTAQYAAALPLSGPRVASVALPEEELRRVRARS
eukprot:TRINITY_DN72862_c0_g1_i1.p1 TRINITY_DN72862_c0_g1~~TRINITY_DN72862_c0_g1_i1.p1  ORF type:complete len:783 (-),score=151.28 TRINITY_DN72862_c0_g1_i1:60-2408(-)